jgi:endonuclease/exonuclease/phosphatase family metal-dependent hydrolase
MFQFSVASSCYAGWFDDVVDWVENAAEDVSDWTAGDDTEEFLDFVTEATSCSGYSSSGSVAFEMPKALAETTGQFSVLTYNVHGFPKFIQGVIEAEMTRISELIESWDIDMVGIQEDWVTHEELISQLSTTTYPYRTDHYCGTPTTFGDGLAIFSGFAFDPDAAVRYQFNACDGTLMEYIEGEINSPDCATEKGFSMARIYVANDFVVDFYTLHHNTGGNYDVNSTNMEQVVDYMAENSAGNAIVLTGDFNMGSTDTVMEDFANNNGFTFVCEEVGVSCGIDMILYKGNSQFELSAVSQEKLDDEDISDHDPRKAVIQWEKVAVNLALGKETVQSSTGWSGDSSRAVDGNTDGDYSGGNSITHTQYDANAWWQVDLGASSDISEIVINNRTDCCSDRLSDFYVLISDASMNERTLDDLLSDDSVYSTYYDGAVITVASLPVSAAGRFVKVQLAGLNYLSLAEVQVLGNEGVNQATTLPISLLGAHGDYFVAENNGGSTVNANRSAIGSWEQFTLVGPSSYSDCIVDGDEVNILTGGGKYFSAQSNGDLDADRTGAYTRETFTLINHTDPVGCLEDGDIISLKSYHNTYVVAESNGGANADRTTIGSWEQIEVILH